MEIIPYEWHVSSIDTNRRRNSLLRWMSARLFFESRTSRTSRFARCSKNAALIACNAFMKSCENRKTYLFNLILRPPKLFHEFSRGFQALLPQVAFLTGLHCHDPLSWKFSQTVLDRCICWDRFAVTLIKPIVLYQPETMLNQNTKITFFNCK